LSQDVNPIVVECEECGIELVRDRNNTRWVHAEPPAPDFPHDPKPVPA
jgi:hypothetical protein